MVASPQPNHLEGRLVALERALANLSNKTLYSASIGTGGITVDGTGGIQVTSGQGLGNFYVGGGSSAPAHADGSPQIITVVGDESGNDRIAVWDPGNPSSRTNQQIYMWDAAGRIAFSTDVNGGQGVPWTNVPLYPRFTPPQNATDTNGTVYQYATISTSAPSIAQGQLLWEGRIAYVSHPRIVIDGTWGQAAGTVVPTYSLTVGSTTVGTWSPSFGAAAFGPWDISSMLGQTQVPVKLSVTWTSTGTIAADALGCYLRQT